MAVLWKIGWIDFRQVDIKGGADFEILTLAGTVPGQRRKIIVMACYIPPNYLKRKAEDVLNFITDTLVDMKRKFHDPQIVIMGDFNQWKVNEAVDDFADVREVDVGATRGERKLDRVFTNLSRSVVEAGTLDPLATEANEEGEVRLSDHRVAYCRLELPRKSTFEWETYTYRYFNEQSKKDFKAWIVMHNWDEVLTISGSNAKTTAFQDTLSLAMDSFFPWKTTRRKSNDLPWLNKAVLRKIEDRKRLYWSEGGKRTETWKEEKRKTDQLINCLLYTSPSPRDRQKSRMPSSA